MPMGQRHRLAAWCVLAACGTVIYCDNIADPNTGITARRNGIILFTNGVPEPTPLALVVPTIALLFKRWRQP